MDLIVAADNASFQDLTVGMGVCGVELFNHPWEVGARKAKEMLFTGDSFDALEAKQLGMVNRVVPLAELDEHCLALAQKIGQKPMFALQATKEAVNQQQDHMGRKSSLDAAFRWVGRAGGCAAG
jgi:enoyl-CoA hydratase